MKRIFSLFLLVVSAPLSASIPLTTVVDGIEWQYTVDNDQAIIENMYTDFPAIPSDTTGDIIVPSSFGCYPVIAIGDGAFSGCSSLTSVTIPESVTSIGDRAFIGCSSLTSVTIPKSVTSIGTLAFNDCSSLTSVVIPGNVTSWGFSVFARCSSLTSVVISEGVTSIGEAAFQYCSSLTSVAIPASVTLIGKSAFQYCSSLTSVHIPEGMTTIGDAAFGNCSLRSVWIPASVTSIENYAFEGCSSLTSVLIPGSVTLIRKGAFQGCSSLTSVAISEGVTSIGEGAFQYCSSLTSVALPESVTSIGALAFNLCSSLKSVVIPKSVTSIGDLAFNGCSSLTSVVIPGNVTSWGFSVFARCSSLTSVVISEGVTSIGEWAFQYCSSLTSVLIPKSVTSIGFHAFEDCTSLTSVVISEGVTTIGSGAFDGCSSLTSVEFPESVTSIGQDCFSGAPLQSIQFQGPPPEGVLQFSRTLLSNCPFPQKYGAAWEKVLEKAKIKRFTVADVLVVNQAEVEVHAEMTTPKTMKVSYTVTSDLSNVKVRAVAFKDGVRSFANIVPVRTGKGVPQGESVETNVEHTFVWEVASDWSTDLDKVAVEILVQGETLLPQELIIIPAISTHKEMTITRNELKWEWLFDALIWCYAEGDERLQNNRGLVSVDGMTVVEGDTLAAGWGFDSGTELLYSETVLLNYLYGKMGYKVLAGEDLEYAESATRLDFASDGIGQVSVKIDEGE